MLRRKARGMAPRIGFPLEPLKLGGNRADQYAAGFALWPPSIVIALFSAVPRRKQGRLVSATGWGPRWRNQSFLERDRSIHAAKFGPKADSQRPACFGKSRCGKDLGIDSGRGFMKGWIATKNLNDFRRKLAEEKDPNKRRILAN
jgi:hypothetical protein